MPYPLALNSPATTNQPTPTTNLLSQAELGALNARISANADKWLASNVPKTKIKIERKSKSNRGRKPKMIENPFYGFIGCTTYWGRYPVFALDIIEGIARLDWHDHPDGKGGKSTPLSVRDIALILESLPVVSNETIENFLQLRERHARRYVKAIELIIPWMMKSRPQPLINEMDGIEPEPKSCEWEDWDEACTPSAEEPAKLHYDLRTLTEYKKEEEYEAEYPTHQINATVVTLPTHHQHQRQNPKRQDVMRMLAQGMAIKAIERDTGVSAKTIRKWRDEVRPVQVGLKAA